MTKERCEYGHIREVKRKNLIGMLTMIRIGLGVFILGLCLNKFQYRNIFTIVAVLFVLPMARYLTTLIVLLPYYTPEEALYRKVKDVMPEGSVLFSDYVFTSRERAMGMHFFVLTGNELVGLLASEKEKEDTILQYLSEGMKLRGIPGKVKLYKEEGRFLEELKKIPEATRSEEEMEELIEYLRSLAI